MFDLDAYFRRIAYPDPRAATRDALGQIVSLHTAAIAFENMESLLGGAPSLGPDAL